jgi:PKHD-type hydroxylase
MSYNYRGISNDPVDRQQVIYPYCFWNDAFSNEEIEKICDLMSKSELERSKVTGVEENLQNVKGEYSNSRISHTSFHNFNDENSWIFKRLNYVIDEINCKFYNFDLNGYAFFQYSEYRGEELGYYDWHIDLHLGKPVLNSESRKLSITLLLNDPNEFQGGEFQIAHSLNSDIITVAVDRGSIIAFPSFINHRVGPVTAGVRKSIVIWVLGPKFK